MSHSKPERFGPRPLRAPFRFGRVRPGPTSRARLVAWLSVALVLTSIAGVPARAQEPAPRLLITEFGANNEATLKDYEGHFSDWIEITSLADAPVDLDGWYLTDNGNSLTKWMFPSVILEPGEFLLVFASGKDRRNPAEQLHTNFKLDTNGEYLALVAPDGETIVSEFAPEYPPQIQDVTYGAEFETEYLIRAGAEASVLVPTDNSLGLAWTEPDFVTDTAWLTSETGVGYGIADVEVAGELLVNLQADDLTSGDDVRLWQNRGALGNFDSLDTVPRAGWVDGAMAVLFDGTDAMRSAEPVPHTVTGSDDWSIEVWVHNPEIGVKETLVNWARITSFLSIN